MNLARPTDALSAGQSHSPRQPRELLEEADQLRQQGKLDRAEAICYPLARRYPGYVAALHTLGLVYLDKGNFERALDCLVRASMLDPANWMTLTALSLAYLRLGASEMAAQTLDKALAIRPRDASIFSSLGEIHRQEREYEIAQQAYRQALTLDPNMETPAVGRALCLSALGQSAEAGNVLREAYGRGIRSLNLLHVMTTLPPDTVRVDILGALDQLAASRNMADAAFENKFLFARAAALDAAGRHAEAWETVVAANRPLAIEYRAELKAHMARRERSLARLRTASPRAAQPSAGREQPISLFILGASRSGKTSLERLISSLDGAKAGCEVPIVEKAVRRSFQAAAIPATSHLEDLPADLLSSFHKMYLEDLARRAGPARVFTNTLPGHIHNARLLASVIPNARFLLLKRSLEDVAWRIYLTKYLSGNPYAYDLKAIREYLDWYNTMVDLIAEKLPDIAHVVSYEAMADDPAATLRRAAELCGLGVKDSPMPALPNDRGCSTPYREFIKQHG
jgi:Flp pilus assembly protein TadD